jgi:hypothetical protein
MHKRLKKGAKNWYNNHVAWNVFKYVTSRNWFEAVTISTILLVGVANGIQNEMYIAPGSYLSLFVEYIQLLALVVFSGELLLKLVAEGTNPLSFWTDEEFKMFNIFDTLMVVVTFFFYFGSSTESTSKGAFAILRIVRLIVRNARMLSLIKSVPQLRCILSGLIAGIASVGYIVMLLALVIYMFAIFGCILFGSNDPARYGTVAMAMVTLFQVATLDGWSDIAYESWYGCGKYLNSPYALTTTMPFHERTIETHAGIFIGFVCLEQQKNSAEVFIFYSIYIIVVPWVIMPLFGKLYRLFWFRSS